VAVMLTKKRPIIFEDFSEDALGDSTLRRLANKVEVKLDTSLDELYAEPPKGKGFRTAILKIYLRSGRLLENRVDYPKGDPMNPMTMAEVGEKFRTIAEPVLGKAKADHIVDIVSRLEDVKDCRPLVGLLSLK